MANYPETLNWVDQWKTMQALSVPTEEAVVWNPIDFTIQAAGGNYNAFGTMSVIKQTQEGETKYWWGYSTQVNSSVKMNKGNTFQQFLYTIGQDVTNPNSNYINFYCLGSYNGKTCPKDTPDCNLLTNQSVTYDCGRNELGEKTLREASTAAQLKGD